MITALTSIVLAALIKGAFLLVFDFRQTVRELHRRVWGASGGTAVPAFRSKDQVMERHDGRAFGVPVLLNK